MSKRIAIIVNEKQALALATAAIHMDACCGPVYDTGQEISREVILSMCDRLMERTGLSPDDLGDLGEKLVTVARKHGA